MKPRLVDLFCGAGGAARGYQRVGFYVVGVDINPQPNYCGDEFIQADALTFPLDGFAAAHASPPCQPYSSMSSCRPGLAGSYAALIEDVREALDVTGLPHVIENVLGAPLKNFVMLCGQMFGLDLYRHRLFETNWLLTQPVHPEHTIPASRAGHWQPGSIMSVAGHVAPIAEARRAMGIDWMTRDELVEAIPPTYTEYVGRQLMGALCGFTTSGSLEPEGSTTPSSAPPA